MNSESIDQNKIDYIDDCDLPHFGRDGIFTFDLDISAKLSKSRVLERV